MSIVREFEVAFNRQDVDALVRCFTEGATLQLGFAPESLVKVLRRRLPARG